MSKNKYEFSFDLISLFSLFWKWKKPLIIVSIVAAVAAIIFSAPFFITPKFKSTLIFYPTATNSVAEVLLDNKNGKEDVLAFGEEEQVEQVLQILESDAIRDRTIKKFNLFEHYEIKENSEQQQTDLQRIYNSNVKFKRTEYGAIVVTVMDKDPNLAADIANFIGDMVDSTKNLIQHERAFEAFKIVEYEYNERLKHISALNDSLNVLRMKGIYEYESQSTIYNEKHATALNDLTDAKAQLAILLKSENVPDSTITNTKARIGGAGARLNDMQLGLDLLAKYGGKFIVFTHELKLEQDKLSELKFRYDKAKVDYERILPQKFIINRAGPAEKKAYPVRWLMVVISTAAAFTISFLLVFIVEFVRGSIASDDN